MHEGTAIIRVRGRAVATLDEEDAKAAGSPSLVIYGDELETRLLHFVDEHRERHSLQQLAFHVFFSVFLVLLGFLTLRGLNRAFARADTFIEDRDHRPLSVFDVQVLSADAVRGLLATVLLMGRALAAVVVVVVVIAAVLAQFEATRPLLQRIAAAGGRPLLSALETVIAALPGLVLAALLLLLLRGALRFVRVLLDGVAAGRVSSSWLAGAQAPVARPVLSVALVVVALPLVVAAAFGRFGTPIETLALTGSAVVFLAALPVLAAAVVGLSLVWRGAIKVGDWVVVGDDGAHGVTGEVTSLGLTGVVLVPAGGGTVVVPSLLLLVRPLRRIGDQPPTAIEIRVRRTQKIAAHVAVVERVVRALDEAASVVVVDADDTSLLIRLSVPAAAAAEPATILRAVLVAVDEGTLELAPRGG